MSTTAQDVGRELAAQIPRRVFERLAEMDRDATELDRQLEDPAIVADHRRVRELSIRKASLAPVVDGYRRFAALEREARELRGVIAAKEDADLVAMAHEDVPRVEREAAALIQDVLARLVTSEDSAVGSVILEIRAGTGGDEASIWAADLLEMYRKHAARRGWGFDVMDASSEPAVGGVRSATVAIKGADVWRELAFEAGVHSVKRVPATETQGRIHTSTATVAVLPEPQEVDVKIDWVNDVEEFATTAQGPGGQNVNKVATAVQIKHKPTGLIIRMQESKSQQQNREKARRLLMARLYELERQKQHAQRSAERRSQIGAGDRSEKIRTYRWKEGIVADERLPGEYALRDIMAGEMDRLFVDLTARETQRRLAEL